MNIFSQISQSRLEDLWDKQVKLSDDSELTDLKCDGTQMLLWEWARQRGRQYPAHLTELVAATAAQNMVLVQSRNELVQHLADAGIDALVLKGASLADSLYAGSKARIMSDIDLLVPADQRQGAAAVLEQAGYQPTLTPGGELVFIEQQYCRTLGRFQIPIDLHWGLNNHPLLRNILSWELLWENAVEQNGYRALCPSHALLFAAIHRTAHISQGQDKSIWLLDIYLLWSKLDHQERESALSLAEQSKVSTIVRASINDSIQYWSPDSDSEQILKTHTSHEPSRLLLQPQSTWSDLRLKLKGFRSLSEKAAYLYQLLFPSESYLRTQYQAKNTPLLWLKMRRLMASLRKALSGSSRG